MCDKTPAEALKEELFYSPEHASYICSDVEVKVADNFCIGYAEFLDRCKTEREAVAFTMALAEAEGFVPFDPTASYKAGDKVYYQNRKKALILCVFGSESLAKGTKIVAVFVQIRRHVNARQHHFFSGRRRHFLDDTFFVQESKAGVREGMGGNLVSLIRRLQLVHADLVVAYGFAVIS